MSSMDEHGEVGTVVTVAESSTVTVTVCRSDETLVENVGGEGQEEGSYNEGDGNEIMVEVVGSDVFVDGVSGNGDGMGKEGLPGSEMESFGNDDVVEGETGSGEVGDFGGQVLEGRTETRADEEVVGASGERAEVAVAMEGVESVLGSMSEETHVAAEKVQVTVTEKGEDMKKLANGCNNAVGDSAQGGVVDDEAWNPGIDAMAESSSLMHASEGGQQEFSAEEGAVKAQLSCKIDEIPVIEDQSVVEMNKTISEASAEDGANHAGSKFSDHPTEDAVKGNVGVFNTEETSKSPIDVTEANVVDQNLHSSPQNQQMVDNRTTENPDLLDKDSPSFKQLSGSTCFKGAAIDPNDEVLNNFPVNRSGMDGGEVASCTDSGSLHHVSISPDKSAIHDSNKASSDSGNHLPSSREVMVSEPRFTGGPIGDLDVVEHEVKVKSTNDLVLGTEPEDAVGETEAVEREENLAGETEAVEPEETLAGETEVEPEETLAGERDVVEPEETLAGEREVVEPEETLAGEREVIEPGEREVVEPEETLAGETEVVEPEETLAGETEVVDLEETLAGETEVVEPEETLAGETEVVEPEETLAGVTVVVYQEGNLAGTGKDSGAEPEASSSLTGDLDVGGHKIDGVSTSDGLGTEPNYTVVERQVVKEDEDAIGTGGCSGVESEACDDDEDNRSFSEELPSMKQEATDTGGGDVQAIPESSHEPAAVVERGEWVGMDIDEVLDFKTETTDLDASAGNLDNSVNAESVSGQEIRSTDQVHLADFCISDIETNAKDTHILQEPFQSKFELSREHQQEAAGDADLVAGNEGADSREEVLGTDVSLLENEKLDIGDKEVPVDANTVSSNERSVSVTPMELDVPQGVHHVPDSDAVDVKTCHLADGSDLKYVKAGVSIEEDSFAGNDPPKGAETGLLDTFVQGVDSNVEASYPIEEKQQDEDCVLDEVHVDKVDSDQSKDKFVDDKVLNEGADNSSNAEIQASAGLRSQSTAVCSHCEDDNVSSLPDGVQSLNVLGVSEDKSVLRGDQTLGATVFEIVTSVDVNQVTKREDECCRTEDHNLLQAVVPEAMSVEDQPVVGVSEHNDYERLVDNGEEDIGFEEHASETDQSKVLEKETLKPSSSLRIHQSGYLLPPENEGEFSASDLVWGKVRSHPWWPGQIFDPADASDKAVKYYKKDCFLVAYFGDRTFAWNDASVLKPFRLHFSHIEKQSNSEAFQNAVSCALDEVSRRVELGLSCSCIRRDAFERIECQVVENTGIREESSRRYGVDKSSEATSFEPDKLLQYVRLLAQSPFSKADRLELTISNAQLLAFCRFKGYRLPPMFMSDDESLENAAGTSELSDEPHHTLPVTVDGEEVPPETSSYLKRKLSLKDSLQPKKKERSLSELMGDAAHSPDEEDDLDGKALSKSVTTSSGKKRKAVDPVNDGSDRRISIYAAKVSTTSSSPRPSFKVGECIRRIASQLTGSASILKGNDQQGSDASLHVSENPQRGNMVFPTDISLEEMLSQLQLAARDPKKGYSFLNNIILFFSVFRNSVVTKNTAGRSGGGRKRKTSNAAGGSTEEFEFDDVNDSYWTDRIVHNYPEEQLLQNGENDGDYPLVVLDQDKGHKPSRRSYSRKQYSNGTYETSAEESAEYIERRKLLPAELVLTFAEGDPLPSEINLNKMFRRFGPLKEAETEVDQDSHRARVVFKRASDAEVAHSSAATFKIFGPKLVNYQLSYSPSTAFGVLPLLITQGQEDVL